MSKQKTFDDQEPVLDGPIFPTEPFTSVNKLKPRSREALEMYDRIEAQRLIDDDPLFD